MATVETDAPEMGADDATQAANPEMGGASRQGAPTQAKSRPTEPPTSEDPAELKSEIDRLREALKKANKDQLSRRTRLEELEAKEREREEAQLSEADRIKRAVADATARARELESAVAEKDRRIFNLLIDHAVQAEAADAGFSYPDIVPSLIDRDRVSIDEETGKVTGAKDAVARLAKDKPGLLRGAHGAGSPQAMTVRRPAQGGGAQQPVDMEAELRKYISYP